MKNKLNQPDVEQSTTLEPNTSRTFNNEIDNIPFGKTYSIEECRKLFRNRPAYPTLEEVKKEWEELGYRFYIKKPTTKWETLISIFYEDDSNDGIFIYNNKTYSRDTYSFIMQEHQLLTKTFRALGWFDE